jgi:hypothetical protein
MRPGKSGLSEQGTLKQVAASQFAEGNSTRVARLGEAHDMCEDQRDNATASLIELCMDKTEPCKDLDPVRSHTRP